MYIINDICYAGEPKECIEITNVKICKGYTMLVTFSTGETRLFDASTLKGPVFEPLKNVEVLKNIKIEHGIPTWLDGTIDVAPEYIYEHSYKYEHLNYVAEDAAEYKINSSAETC